MSPKDGLHGALLRRTLRPPKLHEQRRPLVDTMRVTKGTIAQMSKPTVPYPVARDLSYQDLVQRVTTRTPS